MNRDRRALGHFWGGISALDVEISKDGEVGHVCCLSGTHYLDLQVWRQPAQGPSCRYRGFARDGHPMAPASFDSRATRRLKSIQPGRPTASRLSLRERTSMPTWRFTRSIWQPIPYRWFLVPKSWRDRACRPTAIYRRAVAWLEISHAIRHTEQAAANACTSDSGGSGNPTWSRGGAWLYVRTVPPQSSSLQDGWPQHGIRSRP